MLLLEHLPPGWEKKYTDEGRPYYIDHATKLTRWELPPQLRIPPAYQPPPPQQYNNAQNPFSTPPKSPSLNPYYHQQQQAPPPPPQQQSLPQYQQQQQQQQHYAPVPQSAPAVSSKKFWCCSCRAHRCSSDGHASTGFCLNCKHRFCKKIKTHNGSAWTGMLITCGAIKKPMLHAWATRIVPATERNGPRN